MPPSEPVRWQPLSQLPLVASMIDGALGDTADHLRTLTEARARPRVLDDATLDRVERVHQEQLDFVEIYAEQLHRWRSASPSAAQARELDRLDQQNHRLRQVTTEVLALARELREGTIDRVMAMSDLDLGLQALLGTLPPRRP
jgi:signal transduction histidine kinase